MRIITVTLLSLCLWKSAIANAANTDVHNWIEVYPQSFEQVEDFFIQRGCKFHQNAAAIYEPSSERWWSPEEAAEAYPQYQAAFTSIACPIVATTAELTELLQLEFGVAEKVLLYFDISRDSGGDFRNIIRQNERMWSLYQERLSLLDKFDLLPKYKIITPRH